MKLETTIIPRKDGTVIVSLGATKYVFVADDFGAMSCDVEDMTDVACLMNLGEFHPANPEDYEIAADLVDATKRDDDPDNEGEDDPDPDMNAPPIEESAPARGAKKKLVK